jgi:hypothetical protein
MLRICRSFFMKLKESNGGAIEVTDTRLAWPHDAAYRTHCHYKDFILRLMIVKLLVCSHDTRNATEKLSAHFCTV